jgi:hypothetical protein
MRRINPNKALVLVVLALALTFAAQLGWAFYQKGSHHEASLWHVSWANSYQTVEEAQGASQRIAVGKVQRVRQADPLVIAAEGEPGGVDIIPIEVVTIQLEKSCKGGKPQRVEVFHTGLSKGQPVHERQRPPGPPDQDPNEDEIIGDRDRKPNPDESRNITLEGDPPYVPGNRVFLFLTDGPEDIQIKGQGVKVQRVIAPEGRYGIAPNEDVLPVTERSFAPRFAGKKLKDLEQAVGGCE